MSVADVDVSVGVRHDVVGRVEKRPPAVSRRSGSAQGQQHLTRRAQLDGHMALPGGCRIVRVGALSVRHPDVAVAIHVDPVREDEEPRTDGSQHIAVLVYLQDGIEVRPRARVRPAPVDRPDRAAIGSDVDSGGRAPGPVAWKVDPVVLALIGIR